MSQKILKSVIKRVYKMDGEKEKERYTLEIINCLYFPQRIFQGVEIKLREFFFPLYDSLLSILYL